MYGAIYETIHGHMVPYRVPYHRIYIVLSIGQRYISILPPFCWQYQDQRWYYIMLYMSSYTYSLCLHKNELDYSFYMIIYCCICILEYIFTLVYVLLLVKMYCESNRLTIYYEHTHVHIHIIPHQNLHLTVHQLYSIAISMSYKYIWCIAILFIRHWLFIVDSSCLS